MRCSVLQSQFRLAQFRLQHSNSADFAESPWFGVPFVLLYRAVIAIFCSVIIIWSGFYYPDAKLEWFIYLTNWSFFFLTLYFICATIVTAIHLKKQHQQQRNIVMNGNERVRSLQMDVIIQDTETKSSADVECQVIATAGSQEVSQDIPLFWYHKALWVLYNIASTAAVLVTIAFWTFLGGTGAMSVFTHAINSVLAVVDTMLSSVPVRLFHAAYPMLYFIVYVIFTVIYWAAGEPSIYPMTDYTGKPVLSIVTAVCLFFVVIPLCQASIFALYCLRLWIKNRCY
ncbi:PREDICTED: protein rolling stone-like [Acropora digitifera]|uniref:protein rolling stone-like n=1 Tax=Acropora digitifera TaxID=70779 RepID=UPI00077B1EA6|nr:PREDICTED: protein rolling stone-like [Acropora digitifera]